MQIFEDSKVGLSNFPERPIRFINTLTNKGHTKGVPKLLDIPFRHDDEDDLGVPVRPTRTSTVVVVGKRRVHRP